MTLKEPLQAAKPDLVPVLSASKDRRRPGRTDHASPQLIPLLRTSEIEATAGTPGTAEELPFEDALAPAKGIAVGLLLSVPMWAAIGGIVWAVL